ncbi:alanine dehydrogenase [Flavobacteriaceae bacterium]|nr:alanine dehydrogenase [Flavobacteriaceae bacterium]MDC1491889.1 alanine dehydrogenase [Flavobacteriaceae bacterium]
MNKIDYPFSKEQLLPQEERLELTQLKKEFIIGIPNEDDVNEKRICLTPDSVSYLILNDFKIFIESGAGLGSNFSDLDYSEAGANIVKNKIEIYKCPIILKIAPLSDIEINLIKPNSILISALELKKQSSEYIINLINKKITCIAFEFIEEDNGYLPIVSQMGDISGQSSVLIASELMSNTSINGKGLFLGNISGVPPTEVVIIGSNKIAESAAITATKLGSRVKIFSNSIVKLNKIQKLIESPIYTSTIQNKQLTKALMRCDVAIGTVTGISTKSIINDDMVVKMKRGAIIIDVSIDTGGTFETSTLTTHDKPTFVKHEVTHYCVPNIVSRYSRTSSICLSNIITPYLIKSIKFGSFENFIRNNISLKKGVYLYNGLNTSKIISELFDLSFNDINNIL